MQFETYPFEKLTNLLDGIEPNSTLEPLSLTIGEPQFDTPEFIQERLRNSSALLNRYPKTAGGLLLRDAIREFVERRFRVKLKDAEVIPTFGTREVLFNFPQFYFLNREKPIMAFTNPFYQIYEGAAIASGAEIVHINLNEQNGYMPNLTKEQMERVNLVILNFPNNPTTTSIEIDSLKEWAQNALDYNFVLMNDECYSEIYTSNAPSSLLEASVEIGNSSFKNILVINSLSKRSSAPGLRSGFIAGDEKILKEYLKYRTYVGAASPLPLQEAAAVAWGDEEHVELAREKYRRNFEIAKEVLGVEIPKATFYIWLHVGDEIEFTKRLYKEQNVKVLPGSFLGRDGAAKGYVRIALVESENRTKEALERVKECLMSM